VLATPDHTANPRASAWFGAKRCFAISPFNEGALILLPAMVAALVRD
jgi:hypothetical protein